MRIVTQKFEERSNYVRLILSAGRRGAVKIDSGIMLTTQVLSLQTYEIKSVSVLKLFNEWLTYHAIHPYSLGKNQLKQT